MTTKCPNCSQTYDVDASMNGQTAQCSNCGNDFTVKPVFITRSPSTQPPTQSWANANQNGKDWLTTLLLCLFLGYLGIHRFYTGSVAIGVVQLFTFGGCGIWTLIDFIMILTNAYKDSDGNPLVRK